MQNKFFTYKLALVTTLLLWVVGLNAAKRPNFVFILTDDHNYNLLGCTGNDQIKTPHIDKLANEGILFTNAHVTSAICTPSRVSIFLSQFERKHGVNFNSGTSVSDKAWETSYPMVMRQGGYYTGYVGKNHSPIGKGGYQSGVIEESFDYWYAGHSHLTFYPKKRHKIFAKAKYDTQVEIMNEGVQDFFSNEYQLELAKKFFDARPSEKPFCLSICFNLPHSASTGTMKMLESDSSIYKTLYRDLTIPLPENYVAKENIKAPKLPSWLHFASERQKGYNYVDTPESTKEYLTRQMQAVTGIDGLVGNLMDKLEEAGVDENTIIIFTSDHGLFMGEYGLGGKSLCYEKCTHVPMIIYNPLTKKKARSKKIDKLVQTIDVAPTLLSYAGIEIPESYQGKDLSPIIEGKTDNIHEYLFTENLWSTPFGNPRCEAVQDEEWKYIRYYKNENLKASDLVGYAKDLGFHANNFLYGIYEGGMAVYRNFVESPLRGEEPVYEELFNYKNDPQEQENLALDTKYEDKIVELRKVWFEKIKFARGTHKPEVYRYTKSMNAE